MCDPSKYMFVESRISFLMLFFGFKKIREMGVEIDKNNFFLPKSKDEPNKYLFLREQKLNSGVIFPI